VMTAIDAGYRLMKYYPAVASNGSIVLEDYANLFPGVTFIPTGKIGFESLAAFARLKNVICIGGSWMHAGPLQEVQEQVRRSFAMVRAAREG
jgi:2-dehydro-3-deoxyphosphogluconate aldolase/(4S)-4-hydroxy-2-oxoglutarate aldolase